MGLASLLGGWELKAQIKECTRRAGRSLKLKQRRAGRSLKLKQRNVPGRLGGNELAWRASLELLPSGLKLIN